MSIEAFRTLDRVVGTPLSRLLGLFKRRLPGADAGEEARLARRILIIKTVAIGDLMALMPAVRAIRETRPEAHIALLTTERVREVVQGSPYIDEIIWFRPSLTGLRQTLRAMRRGRFDLALDCEHYYRFTAILGRLAGIPLAAGFDLPGQGRQALFDLLVPYRVESHEVENFFSFARLLGAAGEPKPVPVPSGPADEKAMDELLRELGIGPDEGFAAIHAGCSPRAVSRRWPAERFAAVADRLSESGLKVLFTGTEADAVAISEIMRLAKCGTVSSVGRTSLAQLSVLAARSAIFISLDTGPLHVAAAAGARVVGLYGPNTPVKWGPYWPGSAAVYKGLQCSPCTRQYLGLVSDCPRDDCMRAISVDDVMEAVRAVLHPAGA